MNRRHACAILRGLAGSALAGALAGFVAGAQDPIQWIDVHVHLFADQGAAGDLDEVARTALRIMDAEGIRTMIVMSPPRVREGSDAESLAAIARDHAPRFVVLGGGGSLNPMLHAAGRSPEATAVEVRTFEAAAARLMAAGARGFGEITAHHLSLAPGHAYEAIAPDHSLLRLLADIAARHELPIDLHLDPVPADAATPAHLGNAQNPPLLKANLEGFERLLAHNRKAQFVWAHAGSDPLGNFTPARVRALLGRHANLSLSIRPVSPRPGAMISPGGGLNPEWIAVLTDFPDRFVVGSDTMIVAANYRGPQTPRQFAGRGEGQRRGIRRLLSELPPDVARRIGHENAERLYHLARQPIR